MGKVEPARGLHLLGVGILATACLAGGVAAPALNPSVAPTQYVIASWQTEQGLPQNSVQAIAQTSDGYLWVGTQEGLARFDGVRFTVFDKSNTTALKSNNIQALLEARDGDLWIGTDSGLLRYASGAFTPFSPPGGQGGTAVRWITQARDGAIWVGTTDGGAMRIQDGRLTVYGVAQGLPDKGVQVVLEDRHGDVWMGTSGGLCVLRAGTVTPLVGEGTPGRGRVYCLHEASDGTLWIGTEQDGLYAYRDGHFRHLGADEGLPDKMIYAVADDRDGNLWIGTYGKGLVRYRQGTFARLDSTEGLSNDVVISLCEDREGDLWAGTVGGGLDRLSDGLFTPYGIPEGLPDNMVSCVLQDRQGSLWFGTYGAGLCRMAGGRMTRITKDAGLLDDNIYSLHEDPSGGLWIGTGSGAQRFWHGAFTRYTRREGLANETVYAIASTRDGSVWFGTGGGLSRLLDGRITSYGKSSGLLSNTVVSLLEAKDGSLWVGTYKGLAHLVQGRFVTYSTKEGLSQPQVFAIHEDASGAIWVGTYGGGLDRLKDGRWSSVTSAQGLFDDVVYCIVDDGTGRFWMTCNKGVYAADKADLDAVADGRAGHVRCRVFGKADGMRSNECNGGTQPAAWLDAQGRLWFPTIRGVVSVRPGDAFRAASPVAARLESLRYDGRSFPVSKALSDLPPGKGEMEIQYTAMTLTHPRRATFRYRLEGFQQDWVEAGARRTAYYTNISPGRYTFRVAAATADGSWGPESLLVLRLRPHFYQTSAFYVLCAMAVLLSAWLLYLGRVSQLKARERELVALVAERTRSLQEEKERTERALEVVRAQEEKLEELDRLKTRFFANVSHEFRTPLTLILGPLEDALAGAHGPLSSGLERTLATVLRNGRTLLRLINELLDVAKFEAGRLELRAREADLAAFVTSVARSFAPLAEKKGVTLSCGVPDRPCPIYLDAEKMEKVLYNLLSNAFKFTPAGGTVTIGLEMTDGPGGRPCAEVWVQDTGPGIRQEDLPRVFDRFYQAASADGRSAGGTGIGLALARDLATLHGGSLEAFSEPGKGARFALRLPSGKDHLQEHQLAQDSGGGLEDYGGPPERDLPDPAPADPEAEALPPSHGTETVLVVEDNTEVRSFLASVLSHHFRVLQAADGARGLEKARSALPDLIISDVMMPVMDGYELCRAVKSDPGLDHIPVILLTAKASQDDKVEGLEVGADDYLAKPFDSKELVARARNLIQMRRQERQLKSFNEELESKVREQLQVIIKNKRLTKYFPKRLVERILLSDDDVDLTSERRLVTVFFTDLAGFTTLTEQTEPEDITALLNEYLSEMVAVIESHGGTLARFMGDGILGFFGAIDDMDGAEQARKAVHMALVMQRGLAEIRGRWATRGIFQELRLRIGIHQDHLTVGNFGSPDHMEYTALGRGINLAKRLEAACTPGRILVSTRVSALVGDGLPFGPVEHRAFKGITAPVPVRELDPSLVR